jgi:hypothetical protein
MKLTQLVNGESALFHSQPVLVQQLVPLIARWGALAIKALSHLWQIEAGEQRHPCLFLEQQARHGWWWEARLAAAYALLGPNSSGQPGRPCVFVKQKGDRVWRDSMLAEYVNSWLRPLLNRRKHTDQGCLELFRFLHNVQPFERGKRVGHSSAELVRLSLPDELSHLAGICTENSSCT